MLKGERLQYRKDQLKMSKPNGNSGDNENDSDDDDEVLFAEEFDNEDTEKDNG